MKKKKREEISRGNSSRKAFLKFFIDDKLSGQLKKPRNFSFGLALYLQNDFCMTLYLYMHCTARVVASQVGDAAACTKLSNDLISKYGIYVQSINYPTVAKGTERLRVAPTPHHTREMMDSFVESLTQLWKVRNLRNEFTCPSLYMILSVTCILFLLLTFVISFYIYILIFQLLFLNVLMCTYDFSLIIITYFCFFFCSQYPCKLFLFLCIK